MSNTELSPETAEMRDNCRENAQRAIDGADVDLEALDIEFRFTMKLLKKVAENKRLQERVQEVEATLRDLTFYFDVGDWAAAVLNYVNASENMILAKEWACIEPLLQGYGITGEALRKQYKDLKA
ncbi:uncharacterized protein F4807DRAFT_464509 [Annulohypoxylon truncatum]|uniref:uncharacterized protein n=1 Tax=Annulohypoxylon truncatum TaxID=327061 RepID=UPI002008E4D7|nr:uncharacterized protein F4807DRAFT_464509 [Annulohypoxylon truncatum]KAI1205628.1 hypothetical protein F4807DRAFT_464509 [Annulohypoxylon truncatum]